MRPTAKSPAPTLSSVHSCVGAKSGLLGAGKIPEEKSTSYMQYAYLVLYLDRKLVDQWCAANTR